jgi:alginate O-acetyltransferase complex protein AlgI
VLFLVGYFKKAVVSDGIAPFVDAYFAAVPEFDGASAWIAVTLYTVQLYCDFSAYSDMAIASAGLLGYELCDNFRFPYFAASITDFWRRWHMSLSSWMRDYLYFPLGGSRGSWLATLRNLAVTWLLVGLWHGAEWRFVLFGGMMAPALALHMAWARGPGRTRSIPWPLGVALTYVYVCLAQILFRAPDLATAGEVLSAFLTLDGQGARLLGDRLPWLFAGLVLLHALAARRVARPVIERAPGALFACAYGVAWALVITLTDPQAQPFVYFQF